VKRALFLLRSISNAEVRRGIRAETTKIEAGNDFLDCAASAAQWSRAAIRWLHCYHSSVKSRSWHKPLASLSK
jgi:hypothetical protein